MLTSGKVILQGLELTAFCWHNKLNYEVCLAKDNVVVSSYKTDGDNEYMFIDTKARQVAAVMKKAFNKKVAAKKIGTAPFKLGIMEEYPVSIAGGIECVIGRFNGDIVGFNAYGKDIEIDLVFAHNKNLIPSNINYVKLTKVEAFNDEESGKKVIPVRKLAEIALDKDITWLKDKKYYIVQDEETAEKIFKFLENYDGPIAYDTETTGLRINCFSKYGSTYMADLAKYNNDIDEQYRSKVISGEMSEEELESKKVYSDKLTGIIFCWKPNESYYFPCGNRMFENLYDNRGKLTVKNIIQSLRAKKRIEDPNCELESTQYMNSTSDTDLTSDFILMDRCRDILQNKHLVAHNGPFEWKVGYMYDIITNVKDDTMILHQIMYKFKDTSRNSGENSSLKYLVHKEFKVDQLELSDFFAGYSDEGPEIKGSKRKKKKGYRVDFSYMDFDGSRAYAPADGDFTLQLFIKYKKDLVENYKELEYIYNVEVLTSCAIAYMEFYGHRIDESKINGAKEETAAKCAELEKQIRELAGLSPTEELNIASPAQMTKLFFERLEIPFKSREEKPSVSKKVLKQYLKLKDADGNPQYPIINAYSEWKKMDTLMTKFFDNLPNFMYPGGFIFSSYKQIETGTGRMSCIEENAKVQVVGGEKCIKDIQVGDLVYCYDDEGNLRIRKVLNVIDKGYKECIKLNWISTGNSNTGSLICTPDHKVLSKDYGWTSAENLSYGDVVYHLHRSDEDRPRMFGTNGISEQEQLVIKREVFYCDDTDIVIHHKNGDTRKNTLDNLELMTRDDHSRMHTKEQADAGKIKTEHLKNYRVHLYGEDNPGYIKVSKEELEQMLIDADGYITKVPLDFTTFKVKCNEVGYDYKETLVKLRPELRDISEEEVRSAYERNCGVLYRVALDLGIGRINASNLLKLYNIVETREHNFSDEEYIKSYFELGGSCNKLMEKYKITGKEVREINDRLNLVYIGISDEQFISVFKHCKGSLRAVSDYLDISWYKVKKTAKRLDLSSNHRIESVEKVGVKHVYDLEVEEFHNFIANEIAVHNCNGPNAQQYPKVVTAMVSPRKNCVFFDADYSQIEYRVLTALAKEKNLMDMFRDPDTDYHTLMASRMYGVDYSLVTSQMRSDAKSFNFGIPYGMGFGSLAILLRGANTPEYREEAMEKYELYFKDQPNVRQFFDDVKEAATVNKYTRTQFNRRRYYRFTDKEGNYNNAIKARALRQAGNAVIQGTAADVFKIAMARVYTYIRKNRLFGKVFITNMVHDEGLYEMDVTKVNPKAVMRDIVNCMQFNIDGYPPLFVGGGFGMSWKDAKGKDAEIHPILSMQIAKSVEGEPIRTVYEYSQAEVIAEFDKLNYEFRLNKIREYLCKEENFHKALHPVIGNLLNTFFSFGIPENEDDRTMKILERFITEFELPISVEMYSISDVEADVEEDVEYEDEDEETEETEGGEIGYSEFALLDESDKAYGVNLVDLIDNFGYMVSANLGVCGIDIRGMRSYDLDKVSVYLEQNAASAEDDPADCLEVVLLTNNNILNRTGYYVKGINGSNIAKIIRAKSKNIPISQGTIEERLEG